MISEFCKVVNVKEGCVSQGKYSKNGPTCSCKALLDSSHLTPPDMDEQHQVRANGTAADLFRSLNLND